MQLIEKSPEGILLNEDYMKFTYPEFRSNIKSLIQKREVVPARSKNL